MNCCDRIRTMDPGDCALRTQGRFVDFSPRRVAGETTKIELFHSNRIRGSKDGADIVEASHMIQQDRNGPARPLLHRLQRRRLIQQIEMGNLSYSHGRIRFARESDWFAINIHNFNKTIKKIVRSGDVAQQTQPSPFMKNETDSDKLQISFACWLNKTCVGFQTIAELTECRRLILSFQCMDKNLYPIVS